MTAAILLVRYRVGVVGESRRVVHIVPLADAGTVPEVLATYCGEGIPLGTVDLLDRPRGDPVHVLPGHRTPARGWRPGEAGRRHGPTAPNR
jgi:hypothetical protein